jgi:hypothetical protein
VCGLVILEPVSRRRNGTRELHDYQNWRSNRSIARHTRGKFIHWLIAAGNGGFRMQHFNAALIRLWREKRWEGGPEHLSGNRVLRIARVGDIGAGYLRGS